MKIELPSAAGASLTVKFANHKTRGLALEMVPVYKAGTAAYDLTVKRVRDLAQSAAAEPR